LRPHFPQAGEVMRFSKTGQKVFYKLLSKAFKNKTNTSKKKQKVAQGRRLFDTVDSPKILDSKLSKFYKVMDLAG
jgi:hypothetical protein